MPPMLPPSVAQMRIGPAHGVGDLRQRRPGLALELQLYGARPRVAGAAENELRPTGDSGQLDAAKAGLGYAVKGFVKAVGMVGVCMSGKRRGHASPPLLGEPRFAPHAEPPAGSRLRRLLAGAQTFERRAHPREVLPEDPRPPLRTSVRRLLDHREIQNRQESLNARTFSVCRVSNSRSPVRRCREEGETMACGLPRPEPSRGRVRVNRWPIAASW